MIVFPMAGQSRRFGEAGYVLPKYMLPIGAGLAFDYSVAGFLEAYSSEPFLFIYRDEAPVRSFLEARTRTLGIRDVRFAALPHPTAGQADTVEQGLRAMGASADEELTIFNIDTFRHNLRRPAPAERGDGYLETFRGSGANWSFVEPAGAGANRVLRTTEKDPISDLCCTGLYQFRRVADFLLALADERRTPATSLPEQYVAPIYNHLIRRGFDIRYQIIDAEDVVFCGVPAEYEALLTFPDRLPELKVQVA